MSETASSSPSASAPSTSLATPLVVTNRGFPLSSPFDDVSGSQSSEVHLALTYSPLTDPDTKHSRWLWVSLAGTTVSAAGDGTLIKNTDSAIGWYLSQTTVKIDVGAGFTYAYVQPTTQDCSGSVSSSISLNAGGFGDVPTVGAGFSSSYSQNITDLRIEDRSLTSVLQVYTLSSSSGGAYQEPSDLLDRGLVTQSLYSVPSVATANLPILTQAVWNAPANFDGLAPLDIEISLQLNFVELTSNELVSAVMGLTGTGIFSGPASAATRWAQTTEVAKFSWKIPFST